MKTFYANLVVATCALHEGCAFSTPPPLWWSRPSSLADDPSSSALHTATIDGSNSRGDAAAMPPRNPTAQEMETIRKELIEKFITLGHAEDYASREVAHFLEDFERSAKYVEMRRIAMTRGNDLGIEEAVQFAGAFLVGTLGGMALNSLREVQAANPDVGFPWIS
eukprot:CAMPEP_0172552736 /NCGR_PEP_ID=MMETSP1067-20121228/47163_1 /TAXON_ID=265564 ORGANISM="Thalassiosira punctigera, Strain Tpunct2005C2" /NCGR_SAMPLE_ID=MMETSP1067 /ASSEMBLY_ACC=CAM_ASM_000444 /LENGTH=164 /DNA_ID=CAMNT_0013340787 /DNA_START=44 /DNA_END=538 /DNA_ORIENTATION=-